MQRLKAIWIVFVPAVLLVVGASLRAEESTFRETVAPRIELASDWQTVLPESKVKLKYRIQEDGDNKGEATRLAWELKAHHRVVSRGSEPILAEGDLRAIEFELPIPSLAEEVSLAGELRSWLEDADGKVLSESHLLKLWILASDPFAGRRKWLEQVDLVLFDPEKKTIERLEKARIPFRLMLGLDALAATDKGLVLIGEGTSFESQGALAVTLRQLAGKGRDVLILAPETGAVFPASEDHEQRASLLQSLRLRRRDVVTELDQRLDAEEWLSLSVPDGNLIAKFSEKDWSVTASNEERGWNWVELKLHKDGGRILICSFPLVRDWEKGPTPRYLFLHILERMRPLQEKSLKPLEEEKP